MRCNVGVHPALLADQHLVAESVELKMVPGMLRRSMRMGYRISPSPGAFTLGKGHMMFFAYRLGYLAERHSAVNHEMRRRGFRPGMPDTIDPDEFGDKYSNGWAPTLLASMLVRKRIVQKVLAKPGGFWRYNGVRLQDYSALCDGITDGALHSV